MEYLVDPDNITDFDKSAPELELVLLFWVCAAGKKAKVAARNLDRLLRKGHVLFGELEPFRIISLFGKSLAEELKNHGIGCYNNKSRSMLELASSGIDLKLCSVSDLESIRGIGPKTARCFLMHSRRNVRHAGLDTHCLKYLRERGFNVPKSTPTGRKYLELESIFLKMADESGKSVAEFDLEIWKRYSGKQQYA
jgi:thermostable 8-oxoguanine DNA glycosylase